MAKPKLNSDEAVALRIMLECPFCDCYLDNEEMYLFKHDNRIMLVCGECGELVVDFLHIKCLDMGDCGNVGQCENCDRKFKCYTTRGRNETG